MCVYVQVNMYIMLSIQIHTLIYIKYNAKNPKLLPSENGGRYIFIRPHVRCLLAVIELLFTPRAPPLPASRRRF